MYTRDMQKFLVSINMVLEVEAFDDGDLSSVMEDAFGPGEFGSAIEVKEFSIVDHAEL